MTLSDKVKQYLSVPLGFILEYVSIVSIFFKKWLNKIGLTNKQNYEEIFCQLLRDKNYDDALKLAQQEKYLDIDLVYKCKWKWNTGITVQWIDRVLSKIHDKLWAINECVQTVPMSYEACRCLIEYGLEEANIRLLYELGNDTIADDKAKHEGKLTKKTKKDAQKSNLDSNVSDEDIVNLIDFSHLNIHQRELCKYRQDLIRYEHSLLCYESILGDHRTVNQLFDHVFYDEFRRKTPLEFCLDYANTGDSKAVEICLAFYPDELKPHLLSILSNFPETLSPYQYRNLLPCLRDGESTFSWNKPSHLETPEQKVDWSQQDPTSTLKDSLKEQSDAFMQQFYDSNKLLAKFSNVQLKSELLTDWFISRSLDLESRTLLTCNAIQLLHLGMELNIKNLKETHDNLTEFDRIIYDCCTENNIYLSYKEFSLMPEIDRLILITGDSQKTCKDRFRFYVIPYMHRREQLGKFKLDDKIRLLRDYFVRLANSKEQTCKIIYTDLLDRIECDNFVSEWTKGMDDAIDEIGEEIKKIERDRQAKEISSMASQTFNLGDYARCYDACQLIMKKNFNECWALCCQLGMHKQFNNNEAKYKLLSFALAHCDDPDGRMSVKILNYIIDLRKRDEKLQMAYLRGNM